MDGPDLADTLEFVQALGKPSVADVLDDARRSGRTLLQPRCGVGSHVEMMALLRALEAGARPDLLTVTIDSHTRLGRYAEAARAVAEAPGELNGYPLVTHGWKLGREVNACVSAPLQVRHGSPDPRDLFAVTLASGITSFEGGGISYNLPYSKDVPLAVSLEAYRSVDALCGELAGRGLVVDRELFGTLTAVLVPPSISLAVSVLEGVLAAAQGVRCLSVAYPQGGNAVQDVAALRAVPELFARYVPGVVVHPVLHEFMGVFPRDRRGASQMIFYGALVGRLGGATKVVTKTRDEGFGIPGAAANVDGLLTAGLATSSLLDFVRVDAAAVADEQEWIVREVAEIVEPVLFSRDLAAGVVTAFGCGRLDIPFSASRHARSQVMPRRDATGAIRYLDPGNLPFSGVVRKRNARLLDHCADLDPASFLTGIEGDINYFRDRR